MQENPSSHSADSNDAAAKPISNVGSLSYLEIGFKK
jgi:hypothetical protein